MSQVFQGSNVSRKSECVEWEGGEGTTVEVVRKRLEARTGSQENGVS